jgi:hypothetical protein
MQEVLFADAIYSCGFEMLGQLHPRHLMSYSSTVGLHPRRRKCLRFCARARGCVYVCACVCERDTVWAYTHDVAIVFVLLSACAQLCVGECVCVCVHARVCVRV